MRQLVTEISFEFRIHARNAANRNPQLAIVQRTRPRWRLCNVHEFSFRVKDDDNVLVWLEAELARNVLIGSLERRQNLLLQFWRSLVSLIMQCEVAALFAARFLFNLQFPFGFVEKAADGRIGREFLRALPCCNGVGGAIS